MKERDQKGKDLPTSSGNVSRRALLKGSAAAVPVLLTLPSGAAQARSSNLISTTDYQTKDHLDRTLCLDTDSVYPAGRRRGGGAGRRGKVYDVGDPAYARVTAIRDRVYRVQPTARSPRANAMQMCQKGGKFYYRKSYWSWNANWEEVQLKKGGAMVSMRALKSFASNIDVLDL